MGRMIEGGGQDLALKGQKFKIILEKKAYEKKKMRVK